MHAGEYGKYEFDISHTPIGRPLLMGCFQFNRWNVTTFELKIEVDSSQGTVTYSGIFSYIEENGNKEYETIQAAQKLSEGSLQVRFGL